MENRCSPLTSPTRTTAPIRSAGCATASSCPRAYTPDDSYYILNNYLGGIRKTGQQLVKLKKEAGKLDEPVVLMVYGDHNPWLGDGNSVYEELGVNFDLDTKEGF